MSNKIIKESINNASKVINDAEVLYPQSKWAPKASLMSSYALYAATYYSDAIFYLERHIKKYPKDKNLNYDLSRKTTQKTFNTFRLRKTNQMF